MTLAAFLVNCPDRVTADRIADTLIAARLVASANRYAPIESRYRWRGRVETATEHPLMLRTRSDLADAVEAEVIRLHPFEVPSILRLIATASADYLGWINAETSP